MGIGHSPRIVTDGLVFAMDGSNSHKSWKGKPTTNLITSPEISTTGWSLSGTNDGTTINTSWTVMADRTGPFLRGMSEVIADRSNTWPFIRSPQFTTGSGTFTWSGEYRMQSMSSITSIAGFRASAVANDYGTSGLQTHNLSYTEAGEGWKSFSLTRTLNSGTTYSLGGNPQTYRPSWEWYSGGMNTTGERWVVDFRKLQVEENSFATPFVDGTRSNTQALKDLTGQNTITAESLTYNSNGSFSFDGQADYISVPITTGTTRTVCITYKLDSPGSGFGPLWRSNDWHERIFPTTIILINSNGTYYSLNGPPNNTNIVHIAYSYNGTNAKSYLNGVLQSNITMDGNMNTGTHTYNFGRQASGSTTAFVDMELYSVQFYDTQLTDEQIMQNFNALRGRYGI